MDILHLGKSSTVDGGIERYISDLSASQIEAGHRACLLAPEGEGPQEVRASERYVTECLLEAIGARVSLTYPFRYQLRSSRFDVVHHHYPNPIAELSMLGGQPGESIKVTTFHNDVSESKPFSGLYHSASRYILDGADHVIATSPPLAETSPVLSQIDTPISIVPLGIPDPEKNRPPDRELEVSRPAELLFVGRLVGLKGIDFLLRALSAVAGSCHLTVVGTGTLEGELRELARELSVEKKVEFAGYVSDERLGELYRTADLLVLPSVTRGEGFGYVILEAMSHGTAVLSTDLGTGTSWVNREGETGTIVEPGDSDAIAAAIERLVGNPERLRGMKRNALRRASQFSLDAMCEQIGMIYTNPERPLRWPPSASPRSGQPSD